MNLAKEIELSRSDWIKDEMEANSGMIICICVYSPSKRIQNKVSLQTRYGRESKGKSGISIAVRMILISLGIRLLRSRQIKIKLDVRFQCYLS